MFCTADQMHNPSSFWFAQVFCTASLARSHADVCVNVFSVGSGRHVFIYAEPLDYGTINKIILFLTKKETHTQGGKNIAKRANEF